MTRPRGLAKTGGRPSRGRASDGACIVHVRLSAEEHAALVAAAAAAGRTLSEHVRALLLPTPK